MGHKPRGSSTHPGRTRGARCPGSELQPGAWCFEDSRSGVAAERRTVSPPNTVPFEGLPTAMQVSGFGRLWTVARVTLSCSTSIMAWTLLPPYVPVPLFSPPACSAGRSIGCRRTQRRGAAMKSVRCAVAAIARDAAPEPREVFARAQFLGFFAPVLAPLDVGLPAEDSRRPRGLPLIAVSLA